MKNIFNIHFVILTFLATQAALACPPANKIPDFNCDGDLNIVFIGDSVVYGTGDTKNDGMGGYVLRASKRLKKAELFNFGVAGLRTRDLLGTLNDVFEDKSDEDMFLALRNADIVVLDIGRNDRWLFGTPLATYRNIKRARKVISANVKKLEGTTPFIITAAMMLPNRGSQGPWVAELNQIIRKRGTRRFPGNLRFDKVSKRLLSDDQLHPTSIGYDALAKTLLRYLQKRAPRIMRKLRPDSDKDFIQDIFEEKKFLTDPNNPDTDGDGASDSEEIFILNMDPLIKNEEEVSVEL